MIIHDLCHETGCELVRKDTIQTPVFETWPVDPHATTPQEPVARNYYARTHQDRHCTKCVVSCLILLLEERLISVLA